MLSFRILIFPSQGASLFTFLPFYFFTFKKFLLNRSHLVQEDQENAHRAHEPHKEEEDAEKATANRSPVGKLVTHNVLGHIPADEETGEEAANGQHDLSRHKVEHIEEILSTDAQPRHST